MVSTTKTVVGGGGLLYFIVEISNILDKMYEITFYHQPLARYVQRSGNNLFEREKVFQIIHIVLPTEQSIKFTTFNFQISNLLLNPISGGGRGYFTILSRGGGYGKFA